jgi:hypothetical protein
MRIFARALATKIPIGSYCGIKEEITYISVWIEAVSYDASETCPLIRRYGSALEASHCFITAAHGVRAIRFDFTGIKTDMKTKRKLVYGTVGVGVLGALLGVWAPVASGGRGMEAANSVQTKVRPEIDRATPSKTERAVFALG